jgi:hypothetical protein
LFSCRHVTRLAAHPATSEKHIESRGLRAADLIEAFFIENETRCARPTYDVNHEMPLRRFSTTQAFCRTSAAPLNQHTKKKTRREASFSQLQSAIGFLSVVTTTNRVTDNKHNDQACMRPGLVMCKAVWTRGSPRRRFPAHQFSIHAMN